MNCSTLYNGFPRMLICQTEQLTASTDCPDGVVTWTPGGTMDTIDLETETVYTVDSECFDCPDTDSVTYCFPIIAPECYDDEGVYVEWVDGDIAVAGTGKSLTEQYACPGDAIDWTTMEFDYTNVPSGLTLSYAGIVGEIDCVLDCTTFPNPGVYYVATRVFSVAGIPSNWTLSRVAISQGDYCT